MELGEWVAGVEEEEAEEAEGDGVAELGAECEDTVLVTEVILCMAPEASLAAWGMGTRGGRGQGLFTGRLLLGWPPFWPPLVADTVGGVSLAPPGGVVGADLELVIISGVLPFSKSFLRLSYIEALMPSSWLLLTLTLMGSQGTQGWPP